MWIIFYADRPCFWLSGGELYRAGRQDCHVTIEDDPTISRIHLSCEVGLTPLQHIGSGSRSGTGECPAALTLIDSSTYGTVVGPGASIPPPAGARVSTSAAEPCADGTSGQGGAAQKRETGIVGLRYVDRRPPAAPPVRSGMKRGREEPAGGTTNTARAKEVEVVGEYHQLVKGTPFRVPVDRPEWREFSVVMGRRGAKLTFLWVDIRVMVRDVNADLHTKLEHQFSHCGVWLAREGEEEKEEMLGAGPSPSVEQPVADFLVTEVIRPTPEVLAMLLRGCPVVRPGYFDRVLHRATPQDALPDPQAYLPEIDVGAWAGALAGEGAAAAALDATRLAAYFTPQPRREQLFAGLTFAVFQRELFDSVRRYIGSGQGRALWDESLLGVVNDRTRQDILAAFGRRHRHHVLVFSEEEPMPFRGCLAALQDELKLPCIEHRHLVAAILTATPPSQFLPAAGDDAATTTSAACSGRPSAAVLSESTAAARTTTTIGRRTDANPVFPSLNLPVEGGGGGLNESELCGLAAGRVVDENGWTSWESPAGQQQEEKEERRSRHHHDGEGGVEAEEEGQAPRRSRRMSCASSKKGEVSRHHRGNTISTTTTTDDDPVAVRLPPYPCFEGNLGGASARVSTRELPGTASSKSFHKQAYQQSTCSGRKAAKSCEADVFELDWDAHAREVAANPLTSRVPDMDADTLLPNRADLIGAGLHLGRSGNGGGGRGGSANLNLAAINTPIASDAFNTYDTAAHHAVQRRKAAKATPANKGRGKAARPIALVVPDAPPAIAVPTVTAAALQGTGGSSGVQRRRDRLHDEPAEDLESPLDIIVDSGDGDHGAFGIFDIEGIY